MTDEPNPLCVEVRQGEPPEQRLAATSDLGVKHVPDLLKVLGSLREDVPATLDLSKAQRVDTGAAWAILSGLARLQSRGGQMSIAGMSESVALVFQTVREAEHVPEPERARRHGFVEWLERVGHDVSDIWRTAAEFSGVVGLFLVRLGQGLTHPRRFRLTALTHHCHDVGLRAVPVVALLSFLIGIVLAFQGSAQLRQFGAEIFVVDLIAIAVLRELGVLLTAIIVAGRTASSFTASIGAMKMRQEIDAMHILGVDPGHALIVPRILALILMLPILTLIANVAGLVGGGLMAWLELGISPARFMTRLTETTELGHAIVGMVKAPVFALLIGAIGCEAGLRVAGTTESLGRMTSASVVASIFAVVVADALFSIFFQIVGV